VKEEHNVGKPTREAMEINDICVMADGGYEDQRIGDEFSVEDVHSTQLPEFILFELIHQVDAILRHRLHGAQKQSDTLHRLVWDHSSNEIIHCARGGSVE